MLKISKAFFKYYFRTYQYFTAQNDPHLVIGKWARHYRSKQLKFEKYVRPNYCSAGMALCNVGRVKCRPFLKQQPLEMGTKKIFKGSRCFQFPEAVVTSTAKESVHLSTRSLQVLAI